MTEKAIQQKIAQLTELLKDKDRKDENVLRVLYELFQVSHEGRELSLDTLEWLNKTACPFLSEQLINALTKLRLHVYAFKFAALNFIDIDDVIDDLLNGEILKTVHSLPPGAYNKLKRFFLQPSPTRPWSQQQPQSPLTLGKTPACPPPGTLRRSASNVGVGSMARPHHDYQINHQDQTTPSSPSSLTVPVQRIATYGLLANIPKPQYSNVSTQTDCVTSPSDSEVSNVHCEPVSPRLEEAPLVETDGKVMYHQSTSLTDSKVYNSSLSLRQDSTISASSPDGDLTGVSKQSSFSWSKSEQPTLAKEKSTNGDSNNPHLVPSNRVSRSSEEESQAKTSEKDEEGFHRSETSVFATSSKPDNASERKEDSKSVITPAASKSSQMPLPLDHSTSSVTTATEGLSLCLKPRISTAPNLVKSGRFSTTSDDSKVDSHFKPGSTQFDDVPQRTNRNKYRQREAYLLAGILAGITILAVLFIWACVFVAPYLVSAIISFSTSVVSLVASVEAPAAMTVIDRKFADYLAKFPDIRIITEEELNLRKSLFLAAVTRIEQHNADVSQPYKRKLNRFSVMTEEEKRKYMGGFKVPQHDDRTSEEIKPGIKSPSSRQAPVSMDLRKTNCIGPVKDQGKCGSCWAFASIASLEFSHCMKLNKKIYVSLSEQQLIDCNTHSAGCDGGTAHNGWTYIQTAGGSVSDAIYPYVSGATESAGQCAFSPTDVVVSVSSWGKVYGDVDGITDALHQYGALFIGVRTNDAFSEYSSGVFFDCPTNYRCCDHAMTLIGYGTDIATGRDYWLVRNSWGSDWGENGYLRILKGVNMCGIETVAYYVVSAPL